MALFAELGISHPVMKSLEEMGFESATAIQAEAIPIALSGQDIIGQAQTGTGKTVAFAIPVVERAEPNNKAIQALILTPTRELCIQVAEEIAKVGKHKHIHVLSIYGGQDITRQIKALQKKPHVIVGTPGRLIDHLNRKTLQLGSVTTVVLDEADEMLDMGFVEDIEVILGQCPSERQTMLFSATIKPGIKRLSGQFMHDSQQISVKTHEVTVPTIEQVYYEVTERQKLDVLTRLLDIQNPELAIVFGRTKRRVDELMNALQTRGYLAEGLHGDLSQRQRDMVMRKFREGGIEVLVATDVAARGLDVSGVTHVYNFDISQDVDSYVHRIGRTGRAGTSGIASTFVTPREMEHLHQIERVTKRKIERRPLPTLTEAREGKQRMAMEQLMEVANQGDLGGYRPFAEELIEQCDTLTLVAAALKLLSKNNSEIPITLTEEAPLRIKKPRFGQSRRPRDQKTHSDFGKSSDSGRSSGTDRHGYARNTRSTSRNAQHREKRSNKSYF